MRIKLEWQEGQVWYSVMVDVVVSRNGNYTFKYDGKVYVFKEKRDGEQVLILDCGRWVKAGRVTHGIIFLGPGISSDEYYATPEGFREAQKALESFLASRERSVRSNEL